MNPLPSSPMRLRFGTLTPSKKICAVSDARMPSLSSLRAIANPFVVIGTQNQRFVAMFGTVAGIGEQAHPIRLGAIGDPHLAAIDNEVVAVRSRIGSDLGDVG